MSKVAGQDVEYQERVYPKWSSFLPVLIVYPTLWLTLAPFNAVLGTVFGIFGSFLLVGVMIISSPKILITKTELRVGRARIPLTLLGSAEIIQKSAQFAARGSDLDARAYLSLQASVSGLIRLQLKDPKDPTPYWLFSTRKPDLIVALLTQAKKKTSGRKS